MCNLEKSSEEHLHSTDFSVQHCLYIWFLLSPDFILFILWKWDWTFNISMDYAHRGDNIVSSQNIPSPSNSYNIRDTISI